MMALNDHDDNETENSVRNDSSLSKTSKSHEDVSTLNSPPWVLWKLWSKKIDEAMKEHMEYDFRYYSSLALALTISKEFQSIEGWEALTGDSFFQLLEITAEPTLMDGKIIVETKELRVANNHAVDREYLKCKIIFYDELATVTKNILKPKDCLLIWGGRMLIIDNERVVEANSRRSKSCTCTIAILQKEPILDGRSLIKLPIEVRNKVTTTTTGTDPDIQKVVKIVPKLINMERVNEQMYAVGISDIENDEPTCSKYINIGNVQQNHEPGSSTRVHMKKSRIQNTYSSSQSDVVESNCNNGMDIQQNEEWHSPSLLDSISNDILMEDITTSASTAKKGHNYAVVNEERSSTAKIPENTTTSEIYKFLQTQQFEFDTQENSHLDGGSQKNPLLNCTNNSDSLNASNGLLVDSPMEKSQSEVENPLGQVSESGRTQRRLIGGNSEQGNHNEASSKNGLITDPLGTQNTQENSEDSFLSSYFLENNENVASSQHSTTSNSSVMKIRHSKSPCSPFTQAKSVHLHDPDSSTETRVLRIRPRSHTSNTCKDSGTSHTSQSSTKQKEYNHAKALERPDDSLAEDVLPLLPQSMTESELNVKYNLKKPVLCLQRLVRSDIPVSTNANQTNPKRIKRKRKLYYTPGRKK